MPLTSSPASSIVPLVGSSKPAIIRSVVVLPDPEGPSIVKNSPGAISRSIPPTATTSPYFLVRPANRMSGFASMPVKLSGKARIARTKWTARISRAGVRSETAHGAHNRVVPLSGQGRQRNHAIARPLSTRARLLALVPGRVAGDEADVVAQFGMPARTGFAAFVAGGVPAVA